MISRSILILAGLYSLHIAATVIAALAGNVSLFQIVASMMSLIIVLALMNKTGRWADATALIYSGMLTIIGIGIFVTGLFDITKPAESIIIPADVFVGLVLAAFSAWTVLVFRQKLSVSSPTAQSIQQL